MKRKFTVKQFPTKLKFLLWQKSFKKLWPNVKFRAVTDVDITKEYENKDYKGTIYVSY